MPTAAPGTAPVVNDFAFNRAYHASWAEEMQGTGLRLTYSEHENALAGLHVEKTVRFTAPDTVEATYRVSLGSTAHSLTEGNLESMQSFISSMSVPIPASEDGATRFCWQSPGAVASNNGPTSPAKPAQAQHCEEFEASGAPILFPAEIAHFEIDSPSHHSFTVQWTSARARIVPGNYSALVEFSLPLPLPGAAPAEFTLRYTVDESGP
jgi:hypothetical protein